MKPLYIALLLLAAALVLGGSVAKNAAIRAVVHQSIHEILRSAGFKSRF